MAGRGQLKWGDIEKLKEAINTYFDKCKALDEAPNVADLSTALGIHRDTFNYYAGGRYEHRLTKKAKELKQDLIEEHGEEELKLISDENGIYCNSLMPWQGTDEIDSIKAQVSDVFKTAKQRMEGWVWKKGYHLKNPAMAIFTLKAVHGYTDQPQEVNLHQNNIQLNIRIDSSNLQNHQNPPTITLKAVQADD